ncbi:MAG: c-type cytochrome [Acidobacteria bacterium]|nr:c-type cytochrome [Acidobacteriota bacterium]
MTTAARSRRPLRRSALAAVALAGLWLAPAVGAQPPKRARPLENIKTLKGWDGDEVRAEMRLVAEALGVKCEHCHVQGNFPSDEKRAKRTARRMIAMTQALNRKHFAAWVPAEGESTLGRVTCYTCHQGETIPRSAPPPAP